MLSLINVSLLPHPFLSNINLKRKDSIFGVNTDLTFTAERVVGMGTWIRGSWQPYKNTGLG